jgi:hypothetical protein
LPAMHAISGIRTRAFRSVSAIGIRHGHFAAA